MRLRRNADEEARRRHRARVTGPPTQESIDQAVVDKLRAGRMDAITLYELRRASPGLIPRDVVRVVFQDAFDRLWDENGVAMLDWRGADLTLTESDNQDRLIVNLETGGLMRDYVYPGPHEIPRATFYLNEDYAESGPGGEWETGHP